jgi:hypothetical protein
MNFNYIDHCHGLTRLCYIGLLHIHYRLIAFMYSVKGFPFVAIKQNCLHSPLHNSLECLVHIAY